MKTQITLAAMAALGLGLGLAAPANASLIVTGVVDGPLTGGLPKAVELYVTHDIADLTLYGIGSANNGGGTDGEEFTFTAGSATAGQFIYIASEAVGFSDFFGFAPDYTSPAANINGDDAIEVFYNGNVIDVFGDINMDGSGTGWDHLDGWAYRNNGEWQNHGTWDETTFYYSGINALDGELTNGTAAVPFPIGTWVPAPGALALLGLAGLARRRRR